MLLTFDTQTGTRALAVVHALQRTLTRTLNNENVRASNLQQDTYVSKQIRLQEVEEGQAYSFVAGGSGSEVLLAQVVEAADGSAQVRLSKPNAATATADPSSLSPLDRVRANFYASAMRHKGSLFI